MSKIARITKLVEPQLTVDVEVENTHSYQLSNGWISHNTVSQLVDCASGIHARFSKRFIRRVRCDNKDPMTKLMIESGFPWEADVYHPESQVVFSFPMKVPDKAVTANDINAIEQLELWLSYQNNWCEHKPSMTVYVKEHEWMEVGAWVYRNFDMVSGITFLPASGHSYRQAPYEEITEEQYSNMLADMPKAVDWMRINKYETDDTNVSHREMACNGTSCELVDLVK